MYAINRDWNNYIYDKIDIFSEMLKMPRPFKIKEYNLRKTFKTKFNVLFFITYLFIQPSKYNFSRAKS